MQKLQLNAVAKAIEWPDEFEVVVTDRAVQSCSREEFDLAGKTWFALRAELIRRGYKITEYRNEELQTTGAICKKGT